MRRKFLIGLVVCILFGCMALNIQSSIAWKNGIGNKNISHSTYAKNIVAYQGDFDKTHKMRTTAMYYGTHDWVAERALYLAYIGFSESIFLSMLYLDASQLKMYYLLGTEIPDAIKVGVINPGDAIINTGLNVIYREDFEGCVGSHSLRFTTPTRENLAIYAEKCEKKVADYLEQEDCKAAALFLGAIAHYVADAVYIPHLIDGLDSTSIEYWVNTLTSRKIVDEYYSDGQITSENPFFQWRGADPTAESEFNLRKPNLAAKIATLSAGHAAYEGETEDGLNLETQEFGVDAYFYDNNPINLKQHFDLPKPEKRGDYWLDLNINDDKFLAGIDKHLNIGIYYMAAILTHVKDWYVKCSSDVEESLTTVLLDMAIESTLLWLFIVIGNAATILALVSSLTKKDDVLEVIPH